MFARLAAFVERRAAWLVVAWIAAAVVLTATAPSLQDVGTQDDAEFLPAGAPSQRADGILKRLFPDDPTRDSALLVFARDGGLTDADHAFTARVVEELRTGDVASEVSSVQAASTDPGLAPFLRSPDGAAELVVVGFRTPPFTGPTNAAVERIRNHLEATAPPGLRHHATGIAPLAADQADALVESFDRTAIVTILLVITILLLVYRSPVAALVPLFTISVAFLVARGTIALMAEQGFKVASLAETFMVVMVFGAGVDYCLFIVSRYRQDIASGDPLPLTLRRTMAVIGGVIAASAITVVVGFLSQTSAQFGMYRTMGPAMGVAIFVTLIAGLTLTPAVLRLAGGHAFWPHRIERIREVGDGHSTRWADLAGAVRRLPIHALLGGVIVLLLMSAGLGWYEQSFDLVKDLPSDADSRQGFETLAEHYPGGRLSPIFIVIAGDERITDDDRLAAIDRLTDELRTQPGIGEVRSVTQPAGAPLTPETIATLGLGTGDGDAATFGLDPASVDLAPLLSAIQSERGLRFTGSLLQQYPQIAERLRFFIGADGHSTRLVVSLDDNPYDGEAMGVLRNLDDVTARTLGGSALAGAELAVGGPSSFYVDVQDIGNDDFLTITAVLLGGIFVVLALLLRSLVAPFYLLATVLFSFVATMGLTAGLFVGILDNPGLSFYMPPFLFVILVALGADYNIFIMSRIREEAEAGYEIHQATVRGLVLTGPVITSAGLILAGTFFALVLAPLPNLRQIGFAVTVGVLIDTFIVRSFLVPSITMLLGNWAFWPTTPGVERSTVLGVRRVGLAAAGVIAFALSLILLVSAGDTEPAITRIASMDAGSGIQLDPPLARPPGATSSAVGAVAVPSSSDQDAGVPPGPGAVTQASHMPHRPLTSPRWS